MPGLSCSGARGAKGAATVSTIAGGFVRAR
eukprot:SAG31_NODE_2535_length_5550_cov_3.770134_8_plen_29_part_01